MNLLDYVIANHDNLREHSPGCVLCRKRAETEYVEEEKS